MERRVLGKGMQLSTYTPKAMQHSTYTLRVSVIEHCQLRCGYCLPDAHPRFLAKKYWLSLEHYEKIASAFKPYSFDKIRFTGGEPLLRPELAPIIHIFSQSFESALLALTTNGQAFKSHARALKQAGLKSVTFHLDTLVQERYTKIMGHGRVSTVLDAIKIAQDLDLSVKINAVIQKNINSDELTDFLLLSERLRLSVRFIEIMNTGLASRFAMANFISGQEILALIAKKFNIRPRAREKPSDPAELFFVPELKLSFGLIASDTRPFCKNCTRLRLSADGHLYTCLYDSKGAQLNFKGDEEALQTCIEAKISRKSSLHPALNKPRRIFSMSQTGG